jgi:hypothetical protein
MANEKRLIDANAFWNRLNNTVYDLFDPESDFGYSPGIIKAVLDQTKTVDAVEVADMREFAEGVAYQFGYYCHNGGRLHITHGGLSTLEWAFDILGWENPHPVPEFECEIDGCHEHATCGTPTADGYKRVCGKHFAKMDGDGNG